MVREPTHAGGQAAQRSRREPRILCWNCKQLTPFQEDRCTHCGVPFAGSTGGTYAVAPNAKTSAAKSPATRPIPPVRRDDSDARRSLHELVDDLQRVHDISRPRDWSSEEGVSATLFQCPSCGRFVAESATSCVCGVRFSDAPATFACPECEARVPVLADMCPVCSARLAPEPRTRIAYMCPRCGVEVDEDATRCGCGALFAD